MNFLETPTVIAVNLTISGINETTFEDVKSVLQNIIAQITDSSEPSVNITFLEMVSSSTTRNTVVRSDLSNLRLARSNVNHALINVAVKPRDSPHETYVISKMHDPTTFLGELNLKLGLQGQKMVVITVGQITPFPGTLIYNIRLHKLNMKFIIIILDMPIINIKLHFIPIRI